MAIFRTKTSSLLHETASTLTKHRACAVKLTPAARGTDARTDARTDAIITSELSTLTSTYENIYIYVHETPVGSSIKAIFRKSSHLEGYGWIWMDLGGSGWIGGDVGSKSRYTSQLIWYISDKDIEFATRNCLDPHQTPRLRSEADTRREADGRTDGRTDAIITSELSTLTSTYENIYIWGLI